jgi:hypothetical protein
MQGRGSAMSDGFCYDDRCPILQRHREHNVLAAIDDFVLGGVPAGKVTSYSDLRDQLVDVERDDLDESLARLQDRGNVVLLPRKHYCRTDGSVDLKRAVDTLRGQAKPEPEVKFTILDEVVLKTIERYTCKVFRQIYSEVIDDFGQITQRTVYRSLSKHVDRQNVVHVSWRRGDGGYLLPTSPLLKDRTALYEQLGFNAF